MNSAALPSPELLRLQAEWLAPARSRLLRQVGIAHRRRILDLGAGYGAVTGELVRRGGGLVVALDKEVGALNPIEEAGRVYGDALRLPLASQSLDLVFCQWMLLWVGDVATAVAEIWRVLQPGGVLVALEPDYPGMIEFPPAIATADIWQQALRRAGAEPAVGRQLPGILAGAGFQVRVNLLDELAPPASSRLDFLSALPLTEPEQNRLAQVMQAQAQLGQPWQQVAHLPLFLVTAVKE